MNAVHRRHNMASTASESRNRAQKSLLAFFLVLIPLTALTDWKIIHAGGRIGDHRAILYCVMWTPMIASFATRLIMREGFTDVSFRFGGKQGLISNLIAWIYPMAVGSIAYGIAWMTGLARYKCPNSGFLLAGLSALTVGTLKNCLSAAGEEIGWRGYLVPRLLDAGCPRPILVSGLIWGAWHLPVLVAGSYVVSGSGVILSSASFMFSIVFAGYLYAFLRLKSGSVWPAILAHAAWNAITQGLFNQSTAGEFAAVGESGYLTVAVDTLMTVAIVYGAWKMFRKPGEEIQLAPGKHASFFSNL